MNIPKIKDEMWNGGHPMMRYEVVAEIKREKNIQYELLCQDCNHFDHCRILITRDDNKNYVYVGMVNENCDDSEDRQYYFHSHNGNFYLSKTEAEIEKVKKYIASCTEEIEKHQESIKVQEIRRKEMEDRLTSYLEVLQNIK